MDLKYSKLLTLLSTIGDLNNGWFCSSCEMFMSEEHKELEGLIVGLLLFPLL